MILNSVIRILKKIGFLLGLLVISGFFYLLTGFDNSNSVIDYIVKVNNDTQQFDVEMTIVPNKFLFFDLFFDEPRRRNGSGDLRITNLEVSRGGKTIAHWKTIPYSSRLERLWVGLDKRPIKVTYTVDPYFEFRNRGKMLSYLTERYGYFRGMYTLLTPITFKEMVTFIARKPMPFNQSKIASIQFDLPDGWQVNDPWVNNSEKISIADLKDTYWGFGEGIEVIKSNNIAISIIEEMDESHKNMTQQNILKIYNKIEELTGIQLKQDASFWTVSVLPPVPIHGGASGNYSLLTDSNIQMICHEIFHWWNGFTVDSTNQANWIKEGLTKYYDGKVLLDTGIWSDSEFDEFIKTLKEKLWVNGKPKPIDLITASDILTNNSNSMEYYYQVYNGGALLAYYIDLQLEKEQKSLDQIWLPLFKLEKAISNEDFLNILENMTNETFRNEVYEIIQGKMEIPLE